MTRNRAYPTDSTWTGMVAIGDTALAVTDTGGPGIPVLYVNGHVAPPPEILAPRDRRSRTGVAPHHLWGFRRGAPGQPKPRPDRRRGPGRGRPTVLVGLVYVSLALRNRFQPNPTGAGCRCAAMTTPPAVFDRVRARQRQITDGCRADASRREQTNRGRSAKRTKPASATYSPNWTSPPSERCCTP